jgi:hypothetical protein
MKSSTDYGNTTLGEETISFLNNEQQKPPSWDYRSSLFIHRIVIMVLLITTTLSTSLVFYELYKIPQFPPKTLWSKDVPNGK